MICPSRKIDADVDLRVVRQTEEYEMYASPYQKEETEGLIEQIHELRAALGMCWKMLPDGDYGDDAVAVKRCMTRFDCWPKGEGVPAAR